MFPQVAPVPVAAMVFYYWLVIQILLELKRRRRRLRGLRGAAGVVVLAVFVGPCVNAREPVLFWMEVRLTVRKRWSGRALLTGSQAVLWISFGLYLFDDIARHVSALA